MIGCARPTYEYGLAYRRDPKPDLTAMNELTFGGDHPKLDRVESFLRYPINKIRQWIPRKEPVPDPVEERRRSILKAQEFLVLNELTDVNIDVREYDPAEQWRRLRENDRIHPFWKYTSGTLAHLQYAWLPGRVFHYDSYNPYTNTLNINSSMPSMALYEAAEAKIIRGRRYPGTYLAACYLPIVPLVKDARIASDVLSYARVREEWELERQLYPQIYSALGADLVSQATSLVPAASYMPFYYKPLLSLAGRAAGGATGKAVVREREMQRDLMERLRKSYSTQ